MYTPTIGLEVHAELKTKSKMFCGCPNDPHASVANTNICPICLAHPGTLPVANLEAVRNVLIFGTAISGVVATYSEFDRKNYFYPDIPKAYQISQYAFPFITGGEIGGVEITRVHLEEDTARSQHDKGNQSLIDFNRAGVPLMELVTEPVIHDAKTAGDFARELQLLLRSLGISDANMEKGEMRVEANISVSATKELGVKVEVKNLNSFKSVEGAIAYEIKRQISVIESGQKLTQETRGWDEEKNTTFSQRSKETAKDYRYFPDPDLPKLKLDEFPALNVSRQDEIFSNTPKNKRVIYKNLGINDSSIETILQNRFLVTYFDAVVKNLPTETKELANLAANYLLTDLSPLITTMVPTEATLLTPAHFAQLVEAVGAHTLTSRAAKDIIIALAQRDEDPLQYAKNEGLLSDVSDDSLNELIKEVLLEFPDIVVEYKGGKLSVFQFLLGQAMKRSRGTIDPKRITEQLKKSIG